MANNVIWANLKWEALLITYTVFYLKNLNKANLISNEQNVQLVQRNGFIKFFFWVIICNCA